MTSDLKGTSWGNLPPEVLEQVLLNLPGKDCWNARRVASSWASVTRRVATFEVLIVATPRNVCRKIRAIGLLRGAYPNVQFSFKVNTPLRASECAGVLANAWSMVSSATRHSQQPNLKALCQAYQS